MKIKQFIIVKKSLIMVLKKCPDVGSNPGHLYSTSTYESKCSGFDTHVERFFGPYELLGKALDLWNYCQNSDECKVCQFV